MTEEWEVVYETEEMHRGYIRTISELEAKIAKLTEELSFIKDTYVEPTLLRNDIGTYVAVEYKYGAKDKLIDSLKARIAELEAPKTCDGCKYCTNRFPYCDHVADCSRRFPILPDYYEPKEK